MLGSTTTKKSRPRLLDRFAFQVAGDKLAHYALKLVMLEWSQTKIMADRIEEGKAPPIDISSKCQSKCELPLRYGLPCRH
jgi:hypothetical protein